MILIEATIGDESHTTSSGWARLLINGKRVSYKDAKSLKWLTKFGDKHARWAECLFEVKEGARIGWQAGANAGSRGRDKTRQDLVYIAAAASESIATESLGYPCSGQLRGRLQLVSDRLKEQATAHEALRDVV
jgi:hypothetical protein